MRVEGECSRGLYISLVALLQSKEQPMHEAFLQ